MAVAAAQLEAAAHRQVSIRGHYPSQCPSHPSQCPSQTHVRLKGAV